MKKKMIALTVLVVLVLSIALTGCTFIKVNNERKANEILATVSIPYGSQTLSLNITRNELLSYVNYIINLYSQYGLNFDASSLVEQGLDSLINQKYLVLQGMVYLLDIEDRQGVMYSTTEAYKQVYGDKITPEGVLTISERFASIAETNKSFVSSIEGYIEDYQSEKRELAIADAKEKLASLYSKGYTVKETDGVVIAHYVDGGEPEEGLYQTSFIYDSSVSVETDYKNIVLRITLAKAGERDEYVDLPVSSTAVSTENKEDADDSSIYVTTKVCKVNYDEPVTDDGETTYKTHTAEAEFTLVTPRTAYKGEEEDSKTDLINGDVPYRYATFDDFFKAVKSVEDSDLKKIHNDGEIFKHTKDTYASDAEKDAYRQFRESKKSMNINFTATIDDSYNGLGYYYLSSFESAVLSAVKHERKRAELSAHPITDEAVAAQYNILVEKQKEEYSVLSPKEQVEKFASTVKSDLKSAYYVPIDALLSEEFEYNGQKMHYAEQNADGTYTINFFYIAHVLFKWTDDVKDLMERDLTDRNDEEVKAIKSYYLSLLKTNKSQLEFATASEKGEKLEDAFEVEDGQIKEYVVTEVLKDIKKDMQESGDPLATFKDYMTYFNDDSGSMSSALGYFVPMGNIAHGYDGDDFPNMAIELYLKNIQEGNPAESKNLSDYAYTSYGLHIEYISFAPFYHFTLNSNNALGVKFALDLDDSTFYATIKESLEDKAASESYNNWSNQYSSEASAKNVTKDNKKMKQLLKDLGLD